MRYFRTPGSAREAQGGAPTSMANKMKAIRVSINDAPTVTAGIAGDSVVSFILTVNAAPNPGMKTPKSAVTLWLGGLNGETREHYLWSDRELASGDDIRIALVDVDAADEPLSKTSDDPKTLLAAKRRSFEALRRELGEK